MITLADVIVSGMQCAEPADSTTDSHVEMHSKAQRLSWERRTEDSIDFLCRKVGLESQ